MLLLRKQGYRNAGRPVSTAQSIIRAVITDTGSNRYKNVFLSTYAPDDMKLVFPFSRPE